MPKRKATTNNFRVEAQSAVGKKFGAFQLTADQFRDRQAQSLGDGAATSGPGPIRWRELDAGVPYRIVDMRLSVAEGANGPFDSLRLTLQPPDSVRESGMDVWSCAQVTRAVRAEIEARGTRDSLDLRRHVYLVMREEDRPSKSSGRTMQCGGLVHFTQAEWRAAGSPRRRPGRSTARPSSSEDDDDDQEVDDEMPELSQHLQGPGYATGRRRLERN